MKKFGVKVVLIICCSIYSISIVGQASVHPRIYTNNDSKEVFLETLEKVTWKKELVERKKENLEKYLNFCNDNPEWMVSRLQMNWKTKHDKVFLKGGNFAYSSGNAPVPTVRYSGTRDWATDYNRPKLEDVIPYLDDERGLYLENKNTKKMEWIHPSEAGFAVEKVNQQIMEIAEDAAFFYWLTGDNKYAEFAAPIFLTYMDGMHYRDAPIDLENGNQQGVSGLATFEVIHESIVVSLVTTYDFLYNYFNEHDKSLENAVSVFQKWGDQIINKGIPDNNWNLFQARFLTYIALVLEKNDSYENGKGQEHYLDYTFNISTERQIALKESLLVYDQETAIWPECASYSSHVITTLLRIFTLLDQATNNNEFVNYPIVEKAVIASFQYLFPTGNMVGFGDSHHSILPPENFELLIANYRKYNLTDKEKLISGLLNQMISDELYERKAKGFFELFFYVDTLNANATNKEESGLKKLVTPTFYAPNISMVNQRMGTLENATMVSTVGSFGNHSHANGISIELFANNYVLGPDMAAGPSYWHTIHREYYSRFPAHNTVVVDGKSDYNSMRGYHPFTLDNVFPKSTETPIFKGVTYSKVSFLEPKTVSNQQRFTAIVKSNSEKPYIIDVFRSKKQKEGKQKHEYIYHNLGQSLEIYDRNNKPLQLSSTEDLSSKQGDLIGYDYFLDKFKGQTSEDLSALFRLKTDGNSDNIMKLWVKGSDGQIIYKVKAPKSNAIEKGTAPEEILGELTPTLILKREESAWGNPFAIVFNPYIEDEENPIENVSFSSLENYPNAQIIDVLLNDKITTDRIVLNDSENGIAKNDAFYQKGLLSIVRKSNLTNEIDYIFVSGMNRIDFEGWTLITSTEPVTLSIEKVDEGYLIQNDKPVTIYLPYEAGEGHVEIKLYENDELVSTRKAVKYRSNPKQQTVKLSKAYNKVLITF